MAQAFTSTESIRNWFRRRGFNNSKQRESCRLATPSHCCCNPFERWNMKHQEKNNHAKSQQTHQLNQEIHYGLWYQVIHFPDATLQTFVRLLSFFGVLAHQYVAYKMWGILISIILGGIVHKYSQILVAETAVSVVFGSRFCGKPQKDHRIWNLGLERWLRKLAAVVRSIWLLVWSLNIPHLLTC